MNNSKHYIYDTFDTVEVGSQFTPKSFIKLKGFLFCTIWAASSFDEINNISILVRHNRQFCKIFIKECQVLPCRMVLCEKIMFDNNKIKSPIVKSKSDR